LLDLHHFKVALLGAAFWAAPGNGHVFPLGAGRNAVVRPALGFVVNPATNQTHIGFHE